MMKIIDDHGRNIIKAIVDHTTLTENNIRKIKTIGYDQVLIEDDRGCLMIYDMLLETSRKINKTPNFKKELGERIKTIMMKKLYTEKDLANKLKISQSTISRYLKGQTMPNPITLKKIADALNCYVGDFFYNRF